jgi:hypothetical protein
MRNAFAGFPLRRTGALVAVALLLAACGCRSTALAIREGAVARAFARESRTLSPECVSLHDEVPYVSPDYENSCGVTCLDMILAYEGRALSASWSEALQERVERHGSITNGDLKETLERAGFLAIHLRGSWIWPGGEGYDSWTNPPYHVDQGRPVILRIAVPEDRFHYLLLVGYDPPSRRIVILNPGRGREIWPERALGAWRDAGSWFVAYKPPSATDVARADGTGQKTSQGKLGVLKENKGY